MTKKKDPELTAEDHAFDAWFDAACNTKIKIELTPRALRCWHRLSGRKFDDHDAAEAAHEMIDHVRRVRESLGIEEKFAENVVG